MMTLPTGQEIDASTYFTATILAFSVITACYTNVAMTVTFAREEGVLKRVRGTPLPGWSYLGGKVLHSTLVMVLLVVIVCAFGAIFYDVEVPTTSLPAFVVTLAVGAAAFSALGLATTAVIPNAEAAPAVAPPPPPPVPEREPVEVPAAGVPPPPVVEAEPLPPVEVDEAPPVVIVPEAPPVEEPPVVEETVEESPAPAAAAPAPVPPQPTGRFVPPTIRLRIEEPGKTPQPARPLAPAKRPPVTQPRIVQPPAPPPAVTAKPATPPATGRTPAPPRPAYTPPRPTTPSMLGGPRPLPSQPVRTQQPPTFARPGTPAPAQARPPFPQRPPGGQVRPPASRGQVKRDRAPQPSAPAASAAPPPITRIADTSPIIRQP